MKKKLVIIFAAAFLIRLINLNQSLWLDEAVVAKVIKTIPFHLIPFQFSPGDFHPPFYYMFMSLWSSIFGYSEIALRMSSIITSLLTGWMVYKIGVILFDKKTAFWATVFFLFNPLIIYYSQEARMYMMATFFLTTALLFFIKIIQHEESIQINSKSQTTKSKQITNSKSQTKKYALLILFSALSILTFYGSLFFLISLFIYAIFKKKYTIGFVLLGVMFFTLLLLSPLLFQQLRTAKTGLIEVKNWSLVLGKANIKNLLMIFVKFTSGRLSWSPKISYYAVVGLWSLVVGMFVFMGMRKNRLLTYLFILPLIFAFFISFLTPMLQYFRYLYLIPVMSLLFAKGSSELSFQTSKKRGKQSVNFIILLFYCVFLFSYVLLPQFHREDWKSLSRSLDSRKSVYMILPSSDPVSYYRKDISLKEIRTISQVQWMEKSIYVIPYVTAIYGFDYQNELMKKECVRSKETAFRELLLEEWSCNYVAMIK